MSRLLWSWHMLTIPECNKLVTKHGLIPSDELHALIREVFKLGKNSEVIGVKYKEPKK
jgi:hypothetical protein